MPHVPFAPRPHWELGEIVGGLDYRTRGEDVGLPVLHPEGPLARLQRALIQFMLNEHGSAGFTEAYLPYMLNEASLYAAGQLPKFRDNLYRDAEEDYFFIPTAEVAVRQPLPRRDYPGRASCRCGSWPHALLPAGEDERWP